MDRALVIGLGSAGVRHATNLLGMGLDVVGYDPLSKIDLRFTENQGMTFVKSVAEGIATKPLFAIVATPPLERFDLALALSSAKIPTFLEKPPAFDYQMMMAICLMFNAEKVPLTVGYQMRYAKSLRELKDRMAFGVFGKIHAVHSEFSSVKWVSKPTYIPSIIMESSHELDILAWFFGRPEMVRGIGKKRRWASLLVSFANGGPTATVQLDSYSQTYRRRLILYGDKDSVEWIFDPEENDAAYRTELEIFARECRGNNPGEFTGRDYLNTVLLIEKALKVVRLAR